MNFQELYSGTKLIAIIQALISVSALNEGFAATESFTVSILTGSYTLASVSSTFWIFSRESAQNKKKHRKCQSGGEMSKVAESPRE